MFRKAVCTLRSQTRRRFFSSSSSSSSSSGGSGTCMGSGSGSSSVSGAGSTQTPTPTPAPVASYFSFFSMKSTKKKAAPESCDDQSEKDMGFAKTACSTSKFSTVSSKESDKLPKDSTSSKVHAKDSVSPILTMTPRLKGQVAVITGAGGGIGRETAILFAQHGAQGIVLADVSEAALEETLKQVKAVGGNAVTIKTDVSKISDCENMVKKAEKEYGKLTVLFNNAGIMHLEDDDAVKTSIAVWNTTFDINVKGVFFGCKYGIPAMKRAGGGSIINTSSFVAHLGAATCQLAYTASKGAVSALSRELAVVHARENIRVNALCPGPLKTKLLMDFLDTEEKKNRRLVHVPMGRFGEAKEMANAVVFLASPESSFVTGHDLLVDGGITSAYVTPL